MGHPCCILLNVSKSSNVVCFLVSLQVRCALYFVLVAEAETYPHHFVGTLNNGVYFWPSFSHLYDRVWTNSNIFLGVFFSATSHRVCNWKCVINIGMPPSKKLAAHFFWSIAEFTVLGHMIYGKYLSPKDLKDSYSDLYDINVPIGQERPLVSRDIISWKKCTYVTF
jgi:hypothetical protein